MTELWNEAPSDVNASTQNTMIVGTKQLFVVGLHRLADDKALTQESRCWDQQFDMTQGNDEAPGGPR